MARRYRFAFRSALAAGDPPPGAALVCHPTGTGKTAVIAGLAQAAPEIGNVLILTTRDAIRDQLVRELSGAIFIEPDKFKLGQDIRLAKATYVLKDGGALAGSAQSLQAATARPFTPPLDAFAARQFRRLVPDERLFSEELEEQRSILVMTVQMLLSLAERKSAYEMLQNHIDLVLFDEGHYEPAAQYSKVVRGLGKPVVLLSATPFRNDLKPFQIAAQNIHIYKFETAVAEGVIRDVEVVARQPTRDPDAFCTDIIDYMTGAFPKDKWPRIIIHCEDMGAIVRLGERFIARGFQDQVVGIHDRFRKGDGHQPWQHQSVPPPRETEASIWIHQYKLMEGIDDHRFQVLAFFDPLGNVRSVVQQIGRVIRNTPERPSDPAEATPQTARVLDHYRGRIAQYWELYTAYDRSTSEDYLTKTMSRFYLDKFTEAHPEIDYIEKKFRTRLDLSDIKAPGDEILFDRRVSLKRVDPTATLSTFTDLVDQALEIDDCEFKKYPFGDDAMLYVYAKVESPTFLNTLFFAEARHGARLLILMPKQRLLAVSGTGFSTGAEGLGQLEPVGPDEMGRLLMPGSLGRISSVSSQNTNLGNRVVRRRTISAASIADVPPILDEYGHIVSTVTGYNGTTPRVLDDIDYRDSFDVAMNLVPAPQPTTTSPAGQEVIRRYIGIANGHVSEQGSQLRLSAFRTWLTSLADQIDAGGRYEEVYGRYAATSKSRVTDGAARNLLLDLFDLEDQYVHKDTKAPLRSDDLCVDRTGVSGSSGGKIMSSFVVKLNDQPHDVTAIFNPATQRYKLEAPSLDATFMSTGLRRGSLCRALNDMQSFSIIPDDLSVIYAHGRFYAPGLKFGERFSHAGFFVGHCLYPSSIFKQIASEKGAMVHANGDNYDDASLFALIDGWKAGFDTDSLNLAPDWIKLYRPETVKFDPTLCVCDDIGKESADFILADEVNRRVILVHAKASKAYREYSASAVQEVCAQAQKNTALFSTYSLRPPGNLGLWDGPHSFTGDNKVQLKVNRRIRKPAAGTAAQVWDSLANLLQNPLTSREIWLVLGNMVSAKAFYEGLQTDEPKPETLQLNHLLQTTIAAAGSVGAKTRIFCAP